MKKTVSRLMMFAGLILVCSGIWAGGAKEKQDDLPGIYYGVIPAADCPGIAVLVILNAQSQYKITYQYIDRGDELITFTGNFTYDEQAGTITLNSMEEPSYKAGKNTLTHLDMDGKVITGNLSDLYILRKVRTP